MKAQVSVNTKGLKALVAKIDTIEEMAPLHDLLVRAGQIAQMTAASNVKTDTGALKYSFVVDIEPFSARMHTPKPYAIPAEKGRRPGSKQPSPSMLEQWARRHGIENTFLLARSIAKRGIKGRFFRRKARSAVRKELPALIDKMARQIEAIWGRPISEAD